MTKARQQAWIKKSSVAVLLSTSLLIGQGGYVAAASATPSQVVQLANDLVGTPYQSQSNAPTAFDSAGYVAYVFDKLGVDVANSISGLYSSGVTVEKDAIQPGDVLFFNSSSGAPLNYVGIYTGNNRFVYASRSKGEVIVKDYSSVADHLAGARRYINDNVQQPDQNDNVQQPDQNEKPNQDTDHSSDSEYSAKVASYAKAELGKPYQSGANGPNGFDSAGYVSYVLGKAGVQSDDSISSLYQMGQAVSSNQLQPGDVLFFNSSSGSSLNYTGIYVGDDKFLYASRSRGQVVEQQFSDVAEHFAGARRITAEDSVQPPANETPDDGSVTEPDKPSEEPQQPQQPEEPDTALADKIIATGERFMGTPYKFGAEYPDSGRFDCSSFTQYVYGLNGIKLPRDSRQQSTVGKQISKSELRKGDLVFFRTYGSSSNRITHVAIYAGNDQLLHTYGSPGVTYSKFSGTSWEDRVVMTRRVLPE
ncbi:NlpC/P60 family protein [Brevibacillus humidisoli]|uniref:C40 family peptidase n=1 Tax=Brevibacillus humidisoli TaxID=2895522 RepID=UPI001E2C9120|nr:NlpC/P60 family protein [Brevibacillus humidisoli]UFJ41505.1 NlpC/P60 family protein [Brevibacillus humidisoli]